MADSLTQDEFRELSDLFSGLIGNIHSLPSTHTQVLLVVDEHMRGDGVTRDDLVRLREISCGQGGR